MNTWRTWEETNTIILNIWWAINKSQATSMKTSLDFWIDTTVNQDTDWDLCGTDLYKPLMRHAGKGEQDEARQKGV